jgi:hypothetical protein
MRQAGTLPNGGSYNLDSLVLTCHGRPVLNHGRQDLTRLRLKLLRSVQGE